MNPIEAVGCCIRKRGLLRHALRSRPLTGLLWKDPPLPRQLRRRLGCELRLTHGCHKPSSRRPPQPRLRDPTRCRECFQEGDPALPQALPGSGALQATATHLPRHSKPSLAFGIYRSFRGVQYTSLSFAKELKEAGIVPSMGRAGSAYDYYSLAESFVATLKTELVHRDRWRLPGKRPGRLLCRVRGRLLQPLQAALSFGL